MQEDWPVLQVRKVPLSVPVVILIALHSWCWYCSIKYLATSAGAVDSVL